MSTWISPPPLRSNGLHFVKCRDQIGKLLLNLTPGEPSTLLKKLPEFYNSIDLDTLLESALHLCIHDPINGGLLQAVGVEFGQCQLLRDI